MVSPVLKNNFDFNYIWKGYRGKAKTGPIPQGQRFPGNMETPIRACHREWYSLEREGNILAGYARL